MDETQISSGYVVAITFENVPIFGGGPMQTASFQMLLRPTGTVAFYYHQVVPNDGLVGISSGAAGPLQPATVIK